MPPEDPFASFMPDIDFGQYQLEATPQLAYFSSAPFQGGYSPAQQQYWSGQFGNVYNQYAGALGTSIRQGEQAPSFTDFLSDKPWTQRYTALSPSLRPGSSFRRFSPTTRYAYS
jgi:hypothetical protein